MGEGDASGHTKATDWSADRYKKNAAFVPELGKNVIDMLGPRSGECILDVGCGDGTLTAELQARGCKVIGIDFASDMVTAAKKRDVEAYTMDAAAIDVPFLLSRIGKRDASTTMSPRGGGKMIESTANLSDSTTEQRVGDHMLPRDDLIPDSRGAYDAVFSNAALHWIKTPRAVLDGVKRVLKPGGRFVGEFGGHGNIASIRVALHAVLRRRGVDPTKVDPWYFPSADEYQGLLKEAGFIVDQAKLVPRPTILMAREDMRGWLATFALAFVDAVPAEGSETWSGTEVESSSQGLTATAISILDEVTTILEPALRDRKGIWTADYVRLRFEAHLPGDRAGGPAAEVDHC